MDQELQQFIDFHERNFAYDAFVIWDLNHNCLYASKLYLKYMHLNDISQISLSDLNQEFADLNIEFRNKITIPTLELKKPYGCCYLLRRPMTYNYGLHFANVFPIFNSDNQLIAYCTRAYQMKNETAIFNLIKKIGKHNSKHFMTYPSDNLTERERIVVFLMIIGMSHKEIAVTLSDIFCEDVLPSSVSVLISRQIYPKFDTKVHSILVIKAILNGFFYNIPNKLVSHLPKVIFVANLEEFYDSWQDK